MRILLFLYFLLFNQYVLSAPLSVLIIPFENASNDIKNDTLEAAIPDILSVCFANSPEQIIILDRTALDASLSEQSLSWEKYIAQNSIQSIGQILAANYILKGSVLMQDNKLQVQALLFNVASTELRHSVSAIVDINNLVTSLCENIAQPLLASLLEKTAQPSNSIKLEEMPEKQQGLINGLNHYYNGEFAQSIAAFLKLVKTYPEQADSHFWLAQSFHQAELNDFAAIQFQDFINRFEKNPRHSEVKAILVELESKKEQSNENK